MDFESIKRLGLESYGIDLENSKETYDPSTSNHTIIIHLLKQDEIICPLCGVVNDVTLKGTRPQIIKFASTLEDNITIKLYRREYKCNSCSHHFKEKNPILNDRYRISINKEYKILESLKSITATYTEVAQQFNVSPTYVSNLFDKRVNVERLPLSEVICVDEVYSKKLSYHHYCFIIYNPKERKIIDVLDSRRIDGLSEYFSKIPLKEREKVKYFSMDLYNNYRLIAQKWLPNALICADSFHVIKNLSQFFHQIRIRIMKRYSYLKDDNDMHYWFFKKYFKLLTIDQSKLSYKKHFIKKTGQMMSCNLIVEEMLELDSELKLAYELLHEYRLFNSKATEANCAEWFDKLVLKFQESKINEYVQAWKLLLNWRKEILNSFKKIGDYRVSNGPMERANRDIKTLFRSSFGSRNFTRMRNRIMYSINQDCAILYPGKKTTNKYKCDKRGKYKKK